MSTTFDTGTRSAAAPPQTRGASHELLGVGRAAHQAFWLLRIGFTAAPILFGLDKFFNWSVHWPNYLAGSINDIMPGTAHDFFVSPRAFRTEADLPVLFCPAVVPFLVAAWLARII